jgi:signal transduction histidine kinase
MPRVDSGSRSTAQNLPATDLACRRFRSDAELVVELVRSVRVDAGLAATAQQLAQNLVRLFCCNRILVAAHEHGNGRAFAFLPNADNARAGVTPWVHKSLDRSTRQAFFSPEPAGWYALRRSGSTNAGRFEIRYSGRPRRSTRLACSRFVARALETLRPDQCCIAVAFEFGQHWTCRLFIVDPSLNRPLRSVLRLAQRLVDAVGPAVHNVYVADRLRTSAADTERANLARALHDGVIQSLIAAEMEVHAACRRSVLGSTVPVAELRKIRDVLHNEVLGLRDVMARIKPVLIQPEELCGALSDCVAKFKADTGIASSFSADVGELSLTSTMCPPVVRIVQEALSNVRKHSGARNVLVTIQEARGLWRLVIEDDGRGLDSNAAMPAPVVIRECVRSLGGELQVLPAPGGGLRLDITFIGDARCGGPGATRARPVPVRGLSRPSLGLWSIGNSGPRDCPVDRSIADAAFGTRAE